jgi:hypothetical protein
VNRIDDGARPADRRFLLVDELEPVHALRQLGELAVGIRGERIGVREGVAGHHEARGGGLSGARRRGEGDDCLVLPVAGDLDGDVALLMARHC